MNDMASPLAPNHDNERLKVLVVDDTSTNRQILQVFLKKLGFDVLLAEDGAQAIERFAAERPDVVLMDVMMPVMDGFEATRRIKASCTDRWVPVVYLTALDKETDLVTGLDSGGDDYLTKPVSFVVLDAKLRSLKRTLALQRTLEDARRRLRENADRLQRYHDIQEEENELARGIIERLTLREGFSDPNLRHWLRPAANFSGDVLVAARSPEGRLYAMVGDATGHGLSAAISALPAVTIFYGMVKRNQALPVIVGELNKHLRDSLPPGRFFAASLFCADPVAGQAELWVGGMPEVLQLDAAGRVLRRFPSTQLALGIVDADEAMCATEVAPLDSGSEFVFYSDGLIEAGNRAGEEFGSERLRILLADAPRGGRLESVRESLSRFIGDEEPRDDISLMMVACDA